LNLGIKSYFSISGKKIVWKLEKVMFLIPPNKKLVKAQGLIGTVFYLFVLGIGSPYREVG
jgi:hypothetical protein